MSTITDATDARTLLERALATTAEPALDASDIDLLLRLAESVDDDGATVWPIANLNASAATGWSWKAGLTADRYDLGGGAGVTLDESQFHAHCRGMAEGYASGAFSVAAAPREPVTVSRGIGSVPMVSGVRAGYNRLITPEG